MTKFSLFYFKNLLLLIYSNADYISDLKRELIYLFSIRILKIKDIFSPKNITLISP